MVDTPIYTIGGTVQASSGRYIARRADDELLALCQAGAFAYIPRNVPHTFQIRSKTARWFGIGLPAGFDDWFFETGVPAGALTLPPPPDGPPDVDMIVASLKAYGTDTLGPPPNS